MECGSAEPVTAASALAGAGQRSPPSAIRIVNRPAVGGYTSPPPAALPAAGLTGGLGGTVPKALLCPGSTGRNCACEAASRCLAQVRPSNMLVTDPSLKTSLMARAMSGAIDSTVSLSKRFSGGMGSVLVTMTSLIREFLS